VKASNGTCLHFCFSSGGKSIHDFDTVFS
jgi:hypothetical protein